MGDYQQGGLECFGLEPSSVPYGATVRANLADAAEVRASVVSALNIANRNNQISSSVISEGLANLDALSAGRSFKGCYRGPRGPSGLQENVSPSSQMSAPDVWTCEAANPGCRNQGRTHVRALSAS